MFYDWKHVFEMFYDQKHNLKTFHGIKHDLKMFYDQKDNLKTYLRRFFRLCAVRNLLLWQNACGTLPYNILFNWASSESSEVASNYSFNI